MKSYCEKYWYKIKHRIEHIKFNFKFKFKFKFNFNDLTKDVTSAVSILSTAFCSNFVTEDGRADTMVVLADCNTYVQHKKGERIRRV